MVTAPGHSSTRPPTPVLWLAPAVGSGDASILAGLIWFAALIGAVWAGALAFGLLMTATATLGAWQAVAVRSQAGAVEAQQRRGVDPPHDAVPLHPSHRLPAAALAGVVGCAGVLDTRLAGAVIAAAVAASFIVVGALRTGGRAAGAARNAPALPAAVVVRAGWFIRAWAQTGVAAACSAAISRHSLGAALMLVIAASAYDAGAYVTAAGRPAGVRGPLVGVAAAASVVFALTGLSVPPFAPSDAIRFGVLAVLALPLGPAAARSMTAFARRPRHQPADPSGEARPSRSDASAAQGAREHRRAGTRLAEEWAVRRIDSSSVASLAWMWGLGLLTV